MKSPQRHLLVFVCLAATPVFAQTDNGGIKVRPAQETVTSTETTVVESCCPEQYWDIDAPVRLRAADPQEPCTVQLLQTFDWSTASDGTDDDITSVSRIEWGFLPNHELNLSVPVRLGDGAVEGNADITIGHKWRLWSEKDWLPSFAILNELRVPNGYRSQGVDWTLTGLITKSIVPDKLRVHANPFLKSVNGENLVRGREVPRWARSKHDIDPRHFQWGFVIGADYKINECLIVTADYIHETSNIYGWRNQHTVEQGVEWRFAENQTLGAAAYLSLDSDHLGPNTGLRFNYTYTFDYSN